MLIEAKENIEWVAEGGSYKYQLGPYGQMQK
jgi:hypothetical protein